jgi:hypothetical protein
MHRLAVVKGGSRTIGMRECPFTKCPLHTLTGQSRMEPEIGHSQDESAFAKRTWRCPSCRQEYLIPSHKRDPSECPECRINFCGEALRSTEPPDDSNVWLHATVIVLGLLAAIGVVALGIFGPTRETLGGWAIAVAFSPVLAWWFSHTSGRQPAHAVIAAGNWIRATGVRCLRGGVAAIEGLGKNTWRACLFILGAIRGHFAEIAERLRRQQEEILRAKRPADLRWASTAAVDASEAITYGLGREHVYCYTFPSRIRIAQLEGSDRWGIKVGMAAGDPIDRIHEQVCASKTAVSEGAVALLVFRTWNCRELERWLHSNLPRLDGSLGREWFLTNPPELVALFQRAVDELGVRPFRP